MNRSKHFTKLRSFRLLLKSLIIIGCAAMLINCGGGSSSGGGGGGDADAAANFKFLGTWTGQWTNATFGSSGSVEVEITDNGDGTVTVTVDLGGMVGGMIDPDPRSDIVTINSDGSASYSANQDMLGTLNIELSENGQLTIETPDIPTAGFSSLTVEGTVTETNANLTTDVVFSNNTTATGTVTASKN